MQMGMGPTEFFTLPDTDRMFLMAGYNALQRERNKAARRRR